MAEIWLALLLVATLGAVDPAASQITVANVKGAWTTFATTTFATELSNCDSACPSNVVTTAPAAAETDLDPLCQKIIVYSDCVQNTCTTPFGATELGALEDQCKTAELESALEVIKTKCSECSAEAIAVGSASGFDGKCQASLSYIECVGKAKTTGTNCDSVDNANVEALETPCKDTFMTSTSTKPPTDTTTKTTGTTKNPADVVKSAWANFKQNSQGITACDAKCPFSDADTGVGSSDLTIICKTVLDYTGCAVAKCNMSKTDPPLVALTEPCPDDGDDGCSILQVSILALMLSLLLSII